MKHYIIHSFQSAAVFVLLFLLSLGVHAQNSHEFEKLSEDDRVVLEHKAVEKINDFLSYIPEISAKGNKSDDEKKLAKKYIGLTLGLFIGGGERYQYQDNAGIWRWHDGVKVQTIARGRANTPKPITQYLQRLMSLPYQIVTVDSCNTIVINKIYKLDDGQYVANADVMIVSQNLQDGRLERKTSNLQMNIYIKPQVIDVCGQTVTILPTYLGDIRIKSEPEW